MPKTKASAPGENLNSVRVGKRLVSIREELGRFHGEHAWSQAQVARQTGLTQNIIHRMENGKGGQIENWLKVLALYEKEGYNLNWILTENNILVSKLQLQDATQDASANIRAELLKRLDHYSQVHNQEISDLRALLVSGKANW
ncbi:helix-turn-helix domain-containing protein [Hymenobacter sp. B81]|uniref:helix-turn-helix domain-containing protein n=1 Tax=Hymenobacter sp. B81 TaxID=3344878 RepID=UPI0037DC778F